MTTIDLRTPREKAIEERRKAICEAYLKLKNQHPDCKPNRIMDAVARQFDMSIPGIKRVLIAKGLYETRSSRKGCDLN